MKNLLKLLFPARKSRSQSDNVMLRQYLLEYNSENRRKHLA